MHVKTMEAVKTMEDMDTTATNPIIAVEEDAVHNTTGIGAEAVVVKSTVILLINVPIQAKAIGPQHTDTRRMRCGATR